MKVYDTTPGSKGAMRISVYWLITGFNDVTHKLGLGLQRRGGPNPVSDFLKQYERAGIEFIEYEDV